MDGKHPIPVPGVHPVKGNNVGVARVIDEDIGLAELFQGLPHHPLQSIGSFGASGDAGALPARARLGR